VQRVATTALFHARSCGVCHTSELQRSPVDLAPAAPDLARVAAVIAPLPPENARELVRHLGADPRTPRFELTDGEADEIALALRALARRHIQPAPRRGKRERIAEAPLHAHGEALAARALALGCNGCHASAAGPALAPERDPSRLAPPGLPDVGARLRSDWLRGYLGRAAEPLRPALDARMPRYRLSPADLDAVIQGLAAEAGADAHDPIRRPPAPRGAERALADALLVQLRCATCHADSGRASAVAPALALAGARLRPEAVLTLLLSPPSPERGPRMPALFTRPSLEALGRSRAHGAAAPAAPSATSAAARADGGLLSEAARKALQPLSPADLAPFIADPERAAALVQARLLELDATRDAALLRASSDPSRPPP